MSRAKAALLLAAALLALGCAHRAEVVIPFVGCPSDGQAGFIAAPEEVSPVVQLDRATALQLAYYKGEYGRGVFAPRGWHCQVWYGSSGSHVLVSPTPIDSGNFEPLHLHGPAVELGLLDGGTSGRFGVATYASRLFPKVADSFVERVKGEGLEPSANFERGPYPNDSIRYVDSLRLDFTTPATDAGIGTEGDLVPSPDAIRGFVALDPANDWILSVFRVRVGADMASLAAAIVRLNLECLSNGRC